jgi:GTPase
MTKAALNSPLQSARILIVCIHSPYALISNKDSYFQEFKNLVRSNGIEYQQSTVITLRTIDPGYYITKGKLNELIDICQKENIEEVIFSEPLAVQQERNLQRILNCRVFDRTQLILEIFEKGAQSAEGKLQVALAMLQHQKSRLAGRGIHLSQQGGRIGTRGPGETQKEKDTQHIEHLITKIRRDLKRLQTVRETQRKQRLLRKLPLLCLIGYTNSGKSTLLNALTKSNVLAEDKLFATLDTTTRELFIDGQKKGLISDTVGFIQQIPHNLIEAFKSTLSELQHAHLLLEIIDASDPNWPSHVAVVRNVLKELSVTEKPILYVFNKIDKVTDRDSLDNAIKAFEPYTTISAISAEGINPLLDFLRNWYPPKLN